MSVPGRLVVATMSAERAMEQYVSALDKYKAACKVGDQDAATTQRELVHAALDAFCDHYWIGSGSIIGYGGIRG